MTPQEESMLNDLIGRVSQTQLTEKDPEAEQLLNQKLARIPDVLYILAQTVLVQKYALEQAQAQIQQLQQAPPQPARATSFLGNLLGRHDPAPPPPPPQPGYGTAPYAQSPYAQPPSAQPWSQVPAYGPPPPSSGGSFLRTAATTAAGVAAGALAFEGVESLLHGFGGQPAGLGGGGFFGGGEGRPEETVINNYYDEPGGQRDRVADSGLGSGGNDAMDLQQASEGLRDDEDIQDDSNLDDSSYDDSSGDDSSGDDMA
jgi:uncharacterized protein